MNAARLRALVIPLIVAAVCLRSLFSPGYLHQVDVSFGPRATGVTWNFYAPVQIFFGALARILGAAVAGRVYAFGALFLAASAPMVLFRRSSWFVQCTAGLLGVLNPFVYDRMVEGQWGVVVAAACLFLWLDAWEEMQARPGIKSAARLSGIGILAVAFDVHAVGFLVLLFVVGGLGRKVWRQPAQLKWTAAAIGLSAGILLYGIIPFFMLHNQTTYSAVQDFGRTDFATFRSVADQQYGLVPNLIGLYGYWGEGLGRFPVANQGAPWWPASAGTLTAAALVGAWLSRRHAWLLLSGILALAVSASSAIPGGIDAATRFAAHVPLIAAYREPQKWSAVWLLALVVLSMRGVDFLSARLGHDGPRGFVAPSLAFVLALAAILPAGRSEVRYLPSIVRPVSYPADWYRTADSLRRNVSEESAVVVLPWHKYLTFPFTGGRLILNPAPTFFPGHILVSQDIEIGSRPPVDPIGRAARGYAQGQCALAESIRKANARWVVVLDSPEGRENAQTLIACGFSIAEGRVGVSLLLHA